MKRKWIAFIMVICLLIAMTGCGITDKNTDTTGSTDSTTSGTETIQPDNKTKDEKPVTELPERYAVVVGDYLEVVNYRISGGFENEDSDQTLDSIRQNLSFDLPDGSNGPDLKYRWNCMVIEMIGYNQKPSFDAFGYILKDLDGDSSPELIWVSADYRTVYAIFTIVDNKAVLVDAYWSRYNAVVLDSGAVCTHGSSGADTFAYTCWTLDQGQPDYKKVQKQFGSNEGQYYEGTGDTSAAISKDRFLALLQEEPFEAGSTWKENTLHLLSDLPGGSTRVLAKTQWYEVTETAWLISYTLFDKDGNPAKTEINLPREPRIVYEDGLVRVTKQAGTGIGTQSGYFYDPQNNVFSKSFNCIFDHKNGLVARAVVDKIIVESIFDDTAFYQEFATFRHPFSAVAERFVNAEFSEDGKSIRITYLSGADYEQITEEFALQPPADYLIQETAENVISFPIPHRNAMSAEELTLIRNFVQNKLLAMTGEKIDLTRSSENVKNKDQAYTQYSILMESRITYESDTHVSIVWTGLFYAKGAAHPTHWLLALNYNPKTLQIIPFAEKYAVNNQLYTTFADLAETAIKDACGGTLPEGWDSFRDPLPAEEIFITGMTAENEFYYYLQNDGVTISYPVAHPIGDHKEVTIAYDKLTKK